MEAISSDSSTKKLKLTEGTMSSDLVPTTNVDDDLMNDDDSLDEPNDSEPESPNSDDLNDADSYYDEEEFSYYDSYSLALQAQFDSIPPGVEAELPPGVDLSDEKPGASTGSTSCITEESEDDQVLENYKHFKSFDTVQDYADHKFVKEASSSHKPGRDWAKTIQNEWRILEKDLPETIFVRVYEERMDLLRAAIIGAAGTPYHDGLFFFDCFFPTDYPKVPPKVYYHSGGLRLNPNLYNCGKVCLSLLGTWSGKNEELWTPGTSTMLQVLLSIQALVLNAKPYFNEPGYERSAGQAHGEKKAKDYNESTYVLSLKTMSFSLKNPPKHFEDFVAGHFRVRARRIMEACKEYLKGIEVGCIVEAREEEEEEEEEEAQDILSDDKVYLKNFRSSLSSVVGILIPLLIKNGARDCEEFIPLADLSRKAPLKL